MKTKIVKMLAKVDEFDKGEQYEIDAETADVWINVRFAEEVKNEDEEEEVKAEEEDSQEEEEEEKAKSYLANKVKRATEKVAKSLKPRYSVPATPVDHSDKSFGDFAYLLATKQHSKIVNKYYDFKDRQKLKVLNLSDDTALIPTPLANELLKSAGYEASIAARFRKVQMLSDTHKFPVLNQAGVTPSGSNNQSSFGGGVYGSYVAEDSDASEREPSFTNLTLNAHRYTAYIKSTSEAIQDAVIALESLIIDLFATAKVRDFDYFILRGNGTNQPTGVIDHAGTVKLNRHTSGEINYIDICNMYGRLINKRGAFWIVNPVSTPELLNMADAAGRTIWQHSAADNVPSKLFGLDVIESEFAPALGSDADILLCSPEGGIIGERQGMSLAVSDHVDFLKGRRTWRVDARDDFKPKHASTILLNNGTTAVGNFVQLESTTS